MDGQQIDTLPDIPRAAESKEPFLQPMDVHDSSEDGCIDPLPSDSNISGLLKKPVIMQPLPAPDKGQRTEIFCILGLGLSGVAILACLISSIVILENSDLYCFKQVNLSVTGAEATSFVINILVALVTDSMGFIHGTSLRWALYNEGRLEFNTNIRLFTSARTNAANRWPANIVVICSLILCYAATSQMFLTGYVDVDTMAEALDGTLATNFYVNGIAVAALGLGLLGQAAITTWSMVSMSSSIGSWSSNSLNNTLVLLQEGLEAKRGRCMMSVHQSSLPSEPSYPFKSQKSALRATHTIRYILTFVWTLAVLSIVWGVVILLVSRATALRNGDPWIATPSWQLYTPATDYARSTVNDVAFCMSPNDNNYLSPVEYPWGVQIILGVLFTCAIQGAQTMGLHCVELLVNMSRDEDIWRSCHASTLQKRKKLKSGGRLSTNSFLSALTSWQNLVLFVSKALLHWLLGQCLSTSIFYDSPKFVDTLPSDDYIGVGGLYEFDMIYMRIFVFSIVATFLAIFTTYLALQRPKGFQPAAWGHFQTLANLIDDWNPGLDGRLWWGDKGVDGDGVRHAGTSGNLEAVGAIRMDARYA